MVNVLTVVELMTVHIGNLGIIAGQGMERAVMQNQLSTGLTTLGFHQLTIQT